MKRAQKKKEKDEKLRLAELEATKNISPEDEPLDKLQE